MSTDETNPSPEPFRLEPEDPLPLEPGRAEFEAAHAPRLDPRVLHDADLPGDIDEEGAYDVDTTVAPEPLEEDVPMPGEDWKRARRGRIDTDVRCISCGYNLRGLQRGQRCPECGVRVLMSTAGDGLKHAAPDWLRAIQFGLGAMLLMIGLLLGAIFGPPEMRVTFSVLSAIMALLGALFMTTQEPRMARVERMTSSRPVVRGMGMLHFLVAGGVATALIMGWNTILNIAGLVYMVTFTALMIGMSIYLCSLARRMEDVDLERRTNAVLIGLIASVVLFGGGKALGILLGTSASAGPANCAGIIGAIALVVYALLFLRLLYHYYGVVRWAAHEAKVQSEK